MDNALARLLSIIFALCVLSGAWLLFEYSLHFPVKQSDVVPAQPITASTHAPSSVPKSFIPSNPFSEVSPNIAVTYQCKGKAGSVFRDHPCLPEEQEIRVTASERVRSSPNEIADLKAKADAMEQSRLAAAQQFQITQNAQAQTTQNKRLLCDDIDRQVAKIDAQLRMPNHPNWIDQLKDERKQLMDFRFSSGC